MAVALILAAGRGERLGAERPKALVELAGKPLLQWSVEALRQVAAIEQIVLALPPGLVTSADLPPGLVTSADLPPGLVTSADLELGSGDVIFGRGGSGESRMVAVAGGAVRSESVRLALTAAGPGDPVVVHDAARPLVTAELIEGVIAAAMRDGVDAAIAATPVTDTIKRVGADRVVQETLERSSLWAVQTPQVFRRGALEHALDVPNEVLAQATDDAWLIERAGGTVLIVPAPRENLKITTPLDLALAEILLAERG